MGEWKATVTIRIPLSLRDKLAQFASREQRSLGNLGALLIDWGLQQLTAAGSTEKLLRPNKRNRRKLG